MDYVENIANDLITITFGYDNEGWLYINDKEYLHYDHPTGSSSTVTIKNPFINNKENIIKVKIRNHNHNEGTRQCGDPYDLMYYSYNITFKTISK